MKRRTVLFFGAVVILIACQDNKGVNPYANDMNIPPAVVAQLDTPNYTKIAWQDSVQDFGTIKDGESVTLRFEFKNTGNKPLFISDVKPSCGCMETDHPRDIIMPGKGGELKATFRSFVVREMMQKTIVLTTNTTDSIYP